MTLISHRAREISIFAKPKHKAHLSSRTLRWRGCQNCIGNIQRPLLPPRGLSAHLGGKMMAVTRKLLVPVIPRVIRIERTALANGLRWALDIFHSTLRDLLSHAYFIIYQGSIVARLASRIVAWSEHITWLLPKQKSIRITNIFLEVCLRVYKNLSMLSCFVDDSMNVMYPNRMF